MDDNICKPRLRHPVMLFASVILILSMLIGCGGPSVDDLKMVDYSPLIRDDWEVSTPEAQGLDPMLVADMYYHAAEMETIYSLLVVKNGRLCCQSAKWDTF